jgi:sugar/nucleoside kinase (ribokinase family)
VKHKTWASIVAKDPGVNVHMNSPAYRYHAMIRTGGIGSGVFFALDGEHTLGREESRSGRFLDRRDYCKLHIVSHYVQALLGRGFTTIPIGKVGRDEIGERLLDEMREIGLETRYVERDANIPTLLAVCFIYPDGTGGNLTANDSACAVVDSACIARAEPEFARFAGHGVAVALPEVPLAARRALLELASRHGFLRVASYTTGEIGSAVEENDLGAVDLLALNLDEAAAAAGMPAEGRQPAEIVDAAVLALSARHSRIWVTITAGSRGSWSWDGSALRHLPALPAAVVSTAGAGDAHLAGTLAGLAVGMPLAQAHELGALTAAMSVTSPHTINKEISRDSLRAFSEGTEAPLSKGMTQLFRMMDDRR